MHNGIVMVGSCQPVWLGTLLCSGSSHYMLCFYHGPVKVYIYKFYCLHEVQQMICVFNRNHDALQKYRSEKQYSDDWAFLVGAILGRTIMQGLLVPIVNWLTLYPTVFVTFVLLDVCKIWHQNKGICWPINYLFNI